MDCNAITPQTTRTIANSITHAGAAFIDGGIIGTPPCRHAPTRLYVSRPEASHLDCLSRPDLLIRNLGPDIGTASGIKMCYAALTKGTMILDTLVLLGAQQLGLSEPLLKEFSESQPAWGRACPGSPQMPSAGWVKWKKSQRPSRMPVSPEKCTKGLRQSSSYWPLLHWRPKHARWPTEPAI